MTEPTPRPDVPDLIEMTAAAICNNDNHGVPWDQVRTATAERYRRLATRTLNAVAPEIERQVRERVAAELREDADAHRRVVARKPTEYDEARLARARTLDDAASRITRMRGQS